MHTTNSSGLSLPAILNASRMDDLEELWSRVEETGADRIDGSLVGSIDSQGLAMLLKGLRAAQRRGTPVTVTSPGKALLSARRAFHLQDSIPVDPADELPQTAAGQRSGRVVRDLAVVGGDALLVDDVVDQDQAQDQQYRARPVDGGVYDGGHQSFATG